MRISSITKSNTLNRSFKAKTPVQSAPASKSPKVSENFKKRRNKIFAISVPLLLLTSVFAYRYTTNKHKTLIYKFLRSKGFVGSKI